ncbi:hypothetical protein TIFTF001_008935 [Ficus carica]|uniref:Uncharacterized protein n=1 Tax=Ficus carica TaxID=3494 RepID=A0AA87ZM84_FICCA|nr:hypothetical protein TIFTF001_008935 [Ficus carica]
MNWATDSKSLPRLQFNPFKVGTIGGGNRYRARKEKGPSFPLHFPHPGYMPSLPIFSQVKDIIMLHRESRFE